MEAVVVDRASVVVVEDVAGGLLVLDDNVVSDVDVSF